MFIVEKIVFFFFGRQLFNDSSYNYHKQLFILFNAKNTFILDLNH